IYPLQSRRKKTLPQKLAESNEKLRLLADEAKDGGLARAKHGYYPGRTPLGIRPNVKSKSKCNTKAIGVRRIHKSSTSLSCRRRFANAPTLASAKVRRNWFSL